MYELLIKNAKIIDGTGSPSFYSDIGIENGKIVRVAKGLEGGREVIDASGLTVTPGFIDSHSHSDNALLTYPDLIEKVEQGITTSIAGQCGESPAPISRDAESENEACRTMGAFLNTVKNMEFGSNTACLVGHGSIREAVMGLENRKPTEDELDKMKELLTDALDSGALGMSLGLIYTPGCYAETDELIELAKIVGKYHGIISSHIRDEGNFLSKSVEEFIKIIRESGARGVISHHKAMGMENWGKVNHTLKMIDDANQEGLEIYCDVYPYSASHTSMSARFIPRPLRAGGSKGIKKLLADPEERKKLKELNTGLWGNELSWVMIASCSAYPEYEGLTIPEIAKMRGTDEYEAVFDLIEHSEDHCHGCFFLMCEEDVETVLGYERTMICTDASVAKTSKVFHPRLKASFPRVLGRYVRERGVTTLSEMIRKMTAMPACVYGLSTKGLIREGMDADICIFDESKIIDRSEFTSCNERAEGLKFVIVGGEVAAKDAVYSGKKCGKVILRNG